MQLHRPPRVSAITLLAVLMGTCAWPSTGLCRELPVNGGFEVATKADGLPDGWRRIEGSVRTDHQAARGGEACLYAEDPGAGASISVESPRLTCSPGGVYEARAWLFPLSPARPSVYLQFFDAGARRIATILSYTRGHGQWEEIRLTGVAPAKTASVSVLLFSGSVEQGAFRVDDVSLRQWNREPLKPRGNRLPNPGFELVEDGALGGWFSQGDGPLTVPTTAGGFAARLQPGRGARLTSAWVPARPGQTWRLAARVRCARGAKGTLSLCFVNPFLETVDVIQAGAVGGGEWVPVSLSGVVAPGANGMVVELLAEGDPEGEILVDEMDLRRVQPEGPEVVAIGTTRQLLLDDYMLEELSGAERVFHQAVKDPTPRIVADKPWEKPAFLGVLGNCIFYDDADDLYKMYYIIYQVIGRGGERQHYAVAVSKDGLNWDKPNLGVADYKGSRDNNLIWDYGASWHGNVFRAYNNVIKDPRDPDPARRYKALGFWLTREPERYGMLVAFSPDGLRWTEPEANPVLPNGDTHTLLGWDESVEKYVAYPRTHSDKSARNIGYSTSDDFIHWSEPVTVLEPEAGDPPHYEIYGMPVIKYEGLYLGFPWAFIAAGLEPLDTELVYSRDGRKWRRARGAGKLIPRGPAGAFDDCYAITASPIVVGDEVLFYYMGCGFPHGVMIHDEPSWEGSIGLARLRLDGFASLSAPSGRGARLLTRAFTFTGRNLVVNCRCDRGWLRAEIQDRDGNTIKGFGLDECDVVRADAVRRQVTWRGQGDVGALAGEPVRLIICWGDGELYSFGFTD